MTKEPIKVFIFHGGEAFDSYDDYLKWLENSPPRFDDGKISWKKNLKKQLESAGLYQVYLLELPCKQNASIFEWQTVMQKLKPLIDSQSILVGHSLGGLFLASYLARHPLSVSQLHLIAAPYERCGTFELPTNLNLIKQNCHSIHLWHSLEDEVVSFNETIKYQQSLPSATIHQFINKGHFNQERFDELVQVIVGVS